MNVIDLRSSDLPPHVITLGSADLDQRTLEPSAALVRRIARHVIRRGDLRRPGYAVLANPVELLRERARVLRFQKRLMRALMGYAQKRQPGAMIMPEYLDLPRKEAEPYYARRRGRPFIRTIDIDGYRSTKRFHVDFLATLFVSLCYGKRTGIAGGKPQLLDLLALSRVNGLPSPATLIDYRRITRDYGDIIPHPAMLYGRARRVSPEDVARFGTRIEGVSSDRMPILIFSNRVEDGIAHGATPVRVTGRHPNRDLTHCAIGYDRF